MLGPVSTATGRPFTSVESRSPVAGSSPFVSERIGASPASDSTTAPYTALGTATTITSASVSGASSIVVALTPRRLQCGR